MRRRYLMVGVFLAALAFPISSLAAPMSYSINFTADFGGTLPAFGFFTYDEAIGFSNFFVSFGGNLYDLTMPAEFPDVSHPCGAEGSNPATAFGLLSQSLCGAPSYTWGGMPDRFTFTAAGQQNSVHISDKADAGGYSSHDFGAGYFSIAPLAAPPDFDYLVKLIQPDYLINFSTDFGGIAPAFGFFDYDANTGFRNFVVSWEGNFFNLTGAANFPFLSNPCPGETPDWRTTFEMLSQTLCAGTNYSWSGNNGLFLMDARGPGGHGVSFFEKDNYHFYHQFGAGHWAIEPFEFVPPPNPTPEPGSVFVIVMGLGGLGLGHSLRKLQRRDLHIK